MSTNPYDVFAAASNRAFPDNKVSAQNIKDMPAEEAARLFKKLAMFFHPDRNKDSDATDMIAKLNKAKVIVCDADKRRKHEMGLMDDDGNDILGAINSVEAAKDLFAEFGVGVAPKSTSGTGSLNVNKKLTLSFIEAALGANASVETAESVMTVKLPEGLESGKKLVLKGKGNSAGGRTGDMILEISVAPHKLFARDGNNIRIELPVHFHEAVLGGAIEVPTLRGTSSVVLPASGAMVKDGSELRLPGAGIRGGDQIVTVRIVAPERESLKGWAASQNLPDPRAHLKT